MLAFCREPQPAELATALAHINAPRTSQEGAPLDALASRKIAFEDIIWALCNTKEFPYNH